VALQCTRQAAVGRAERHQIVRTQRPIELPQLAEKVAARKKGQNAQRVLPACIVGNVAIGLATESPAQSRHSELRVDMPYVFESVGLKRKAFVRLVKRRDLDYQRRAIGGDEAEILFSLSPQWAPFACKPIGVLDTSCDQLQGQLRRSNAFEQGPYRGVIEL